MPRPLIGGARWAGWLVCGAALTLPATRAAGQDSSRAKPRTAQITYLVGSTAYLDVGRLDGLREAARLDVVRGAARIGVLKVAYLGSHRASCDIVTSVTPLVVGDTVRYVAAAERRDSSVAARGGAGGAGAPRMGRESRSGAGLRGRVGVQYFVIEQRDGTAGQVSQPSLDLALYGHPLGAPALDLAVDVRTRYTSTILPDGSALNDDRNRVYQAAVSLQQPGSPERLTLGRQISGNLAAIGVFDGALAELAQRDWTVGVFSGTQPEPIQLGFSSAILEGGGYVARHSRPGAAVPWSLTFGASGSYQDTHPNREFAFLQGSYLGRRVTAFFTQEVDYYRAWKRLPGMSAISPTTTFALVEGRVSETVTVDGGFDNRRNVRLYRDAVNPETAFDDAYRQGAWAGVSWRLQRRYRVGFDARSSSGGPAGSATAYTASFGAERLSPLAGTLRTRTTYYTNPQGSGWLESAAFAFEPAERWHVDLNGGLRAEHDPLEQPANVLVNWVGVNLDLTLARAWYALLSATRQRGGIDGNDQLYGGVSFRF